MRGAPVNSEERKAARRARREAERARKREQRLRDCTLENVADLENLYDAAMKAKKGIAWKASTQRYHKDLMLNLSKARSDLMEGRDIRRGFHHFTLYERGKLREISSVHFSERVIHKSLSVNALVPAIAPSFIRNNTANTKGRGTDDAIKRLRRDLTRHFRRHGREGYVLLIDACGDVGLGLGSEPNQIFAVGFASPLDHYVTEMLGIDLYGRYMDDIYCIHESKEYLQVVQLLIERKCEELGIVVNQKKTHIIKLSHGFTWLKKKFSITETGRIVMRPCRESVTRMRRKLKKLRRKVAEGQMTREQALRSYQSWRGSIEKLDAHRTLLEMDALCKALFGDDAEDLRGGGSHR